MPAQTHGKVEAKIASVAQMSLPLWLSGKLGNGVVLPGIKGTNASEKWRTAQRNKLAALLTQFLKYQLLHLPNHREHGELDRKSKSCGNQVTYPMSH